MSSGYQPTFTIGPGLAGTDNTSVYKLGLNIASIQIKYFKMINDP